MTLIIFRQKFRNIRKIISSHTVIRNDGPVAQRFALRALGEWFDSRFPSLPKLVNLGKEVFLIGLGVGILGSVSESTRSLIHIERVIS